METLIDVVKKYNLGVTTKTPHLYSSCILHLIIHYFAPLILTNDKLLSIKIRLTLYLCYLGKRAATDNTKSQVRILMLAHSWSTQTTGKSSD